MKTTITINDVAERHSELEAFLKAANPVRGGLWAACVAFAKEHYKCNGFIEAQRVYQYARAKFPTSYKTLKKASIVKDDKYCRRRVWSLEILKAFEQHMKEGGEQKDFCRIHNLEQTQASRYGQQLGYAQRMVTDREYAALLEQRKTGQVQATAHKATEPTPIGKKSRSFKSMVIVAEEFARENWQYDPKKHESARDYDIGFGILVKFCLRLLEEDKAE